jgi:hypothetical protein
MVNKRVGNYTPWPEAARIASTIQQAKRQTLACERCPATFDSASGRVSVYCRPCRADINREKTAANMRRRRSATA